VAAARSDARDRRRHSRNAAAKRVAALRPRLEHATLNAGLLFFVIFVVVFVHLNSRGYCFVLLFFCSPVNCQVGNFGGWSACSTT
jgi:hypothetical protein